MGMKSVLKVHKALERKAHQEAELNFKRLLTQEIMGKAVEEAVACRTVSILLALREKGWGKGRADWLVNRAYEIEEMIHTGEATWPDLIRKMFDEYGYEEGEFGYCGNEKDDEGSVKTGQTNRKK